VCTDRYLLKTCVDELRRIDKRLVVLDADTHIPGDDSDSVRGQEIARLTEQRETLLKEKYRLQARLAQVQGWPTDAA